MNSAVTCRSYNAKKGAPMKRLESDIVRMNESEMVLSDLGVGKWIFRFFAVMMAFVVLMQFGSIGDIESLGDGLNWFFLTFCFIIPFTLAAWQFGDRTTTIEFDQPEGYLTIKESPWWTILIPAGPRLIKVPTQVPLKECKPYVKDLSGIRTIHVPAGPDAIEIRNAHVESYKVQLPLEDSKLLTIWTTGDRNTYIEIVTRINKAVRDG